MAKAPTPNKRIRPETPSSVGEGGDKRWVVDKARVWYVCVEQMESATNTKAVNEGIAKANAVLASLKSDKERMVVEPKQASNSKCYTTK